MTSELDTDRSRNCRSWAGGLADEKRPASADVSGLCELETARQHLEERLARNEDWRALQQLNVREAGGDPVVAIESDVLRAALEGALERDRTYRAYRAVRAALSALCGEDEPIEASPQMRKGPDRTAPGDEQASEAVPAPTNAGEEQPAGCADTIEAATRPDDLQQGAPDGTLSQKPVPTLSLRIAPPALPATATTVKNSAPAPAGAPDQHDSSDDLTQIWNIDRDLAERLNAEGITTWQHIAEWCAADVKNISRALSLDLQIYRDGWIEQAALLHQRNAGKPTQTPMARCPDDTPVQPEQVALSEKPALPLPAVGYAEARSDKPREEAVAQTLVARPAVASPNETATAEPTPPQAEPERSLQDRTSSATKPDQLHMIRGIDLKLAERLQEQGISSFAALATWSPDEVGAISDRLNLAKRIETENWIEQAAMLQGGILTRHARTVAAGRPNIVDRPPALPPRSTVYSADHEPVAVQPALEQRGHRKMEGATEPPSQPPKPTPKFSGGLPAALARLGIHHPETIVPSHGLNDNDAGNLVPSQIEALSDQDKTSNSHKPPVNIAEPEAGPVDNLKHADAGELEEAAHDVTDDQQTASARSPEEGRLDEAEEPRPGINRDLAATLADIDRLTHETEALLGKTKRTPKKNAHGPAPQRDPARPCEEADVTIVAHQKPSPRHVRPFLATPSGHRPSLGEKVKIARRASMLGKHRKAPYSIVADEASVEIVEHGRRPGQPVSQKGSASDGEPRQASIRRLFKALTGK